MVNPKKLDEKDIEVLNQAWTAAEKKSFSDFLKARKKTRTGSMAKKNATAKGGGPNL